jgi:Ca2+-binding EF-hand superfamily protein
VERKLNQPDHVDVIKRHYDTLKDESGTISFSSLKKASAEAGLALTDQEISLMIDGADTDHDGLVSEHEFKQILFS